MVGGGARLILQMFSVEVGFVWETVFVNGVFVHVLEHLWGFIYFELNIYWYVLESVFGKADGAWFLLCVSFSSFFLGGGGLVGGGRVRYSSVVVKTKQKN